MNKDYLIGLFAFQSLFLSFAPIRGVAMDDGMVNYKNARFTIITPQCVRMEYHEKREFIDDPSLFAINRSARFMDAKIDVDQDQIVIDTGDIQLFYKPDGKPFSKDNLQAFIRRGVKNVLWKAGMKNKHNLGGTERTLDGWNGGRELSDGLLSRDGWFLFDDSRNLLFKNDWVEPRPESSGIDWYLFGYGNDFKSALKSFTAISGNIPLPRKYALGSWYSRYWPYTSKDYRGIVREYEERDFPLDGMVLDMDWHKDGWTGWSWNRKLLPDAEKLLKWFHKQDLGVTMNLHPADGVGPHEDMYKKFMKDMGEDCKDNKTIPFDAGNKKYLDTLFKRAHVPHEKEGVDFWWLDWQQYAFTRSIPNLTNLFWLNHYYYKHTSEKGKRGQSLSRWGGWGDHRHPIHFSGDATTNWIMLAFEIPFTAVAGNVGCFFWSHDIGGHMGDRNEESFTRWCQFGAMSAMVRLHSSRSKVLDRRPWTYPKWSEDSVRASFHLRSMLFPYIYSCVRQSCMESIPMIRPMYIDYPEEEKSYHHAQQYLFGDDFLVAPIATPGEGKNRLASQLVWFPKGVWYNFFSHERMEREAEILAPADINEFPLYVKGGVPVPMQPYTPRMTTAPLSTLIVRCYPGEDGKTGAFLLYEDDGISQKYQSGDFAETPLEYTRNGDMITIMIYPARGSFKGQVKKRDYVIELPCTQKAESVWIDGTGGDFEYDGDSCMNRIRIPARGIRKMMTVEVKAREFSPDFFARRAFCKRACVKVSKNTDHSIKQIMASMIRDSGDEEGNHLILRAAGIGLFIRNQEPYLYPETGRPCLIAPKGMIEGKKILWTLEAQNPKKNKILCREEADHGGISFMPLSFDDFTSQTPTAKPLLIRASFSLEGVSFHFQTPYRGNARSFKFRKNVALRARVKSSSSEKGYSPRGAIDGIVDGHPNMKSAEWASNHEKEGAWLKLQWQGEQTIERVFIFDRPNLTDHVTSGEICFSDGTKIPFAALPNDASEGVELVFPPKKTDALQLNITGVSEGSLNSGISEIVVLEEDVKDN
ncbi:DUF5110 domain-containing protein [Candidatus Sumerlaeota bacterium]|nr:DUF5110 domain-containing protein [Candidatus Sumerlaeota bacterium]